MSSSRFSGPGVAETVRAEVLDATFVGSTSSGDATGDAASSIGTSEESMGSCDAGLFNGREDGVLSTFAVTTRPYP